MTTAPVMIIARYLNKASVPMLKHICPTYAELFTAVVHLLAAMWVEVTPPSKEAVVDSWESFLHAGQAGSHVAGGSGVGGCWWSLLVSVVFSK